MKGITFYFGYDIVDKESNVKMIKEAGFECVMTNADKRFNNENGSIKSQVKLLKKYGLKHSSLHMQYKASELENFFLDNKIGKKLEKNLIKDLKIAKKYNFLCVVVHLVGEISQVGIDRFARILKVAEKLQVPLALENLKDNTPMRYFLNNFNSPYVKFCFDAGHQHCFTPNEDLLTEFRDRLICVHLHDNMGDADSHTLNEFGNIDWKEIAKKLSKCPPVNLDYELLFKKKCDYTAKEVLTKCINQAIELENLINKYKQTKK